MSELPPKPTGRLLVTFAMPDEFRPLRRRTAVLARVDVLVTGMGFANARQAMESFLATQRPAAVLTCGFAGGLDPKFGHGALLFEASDDFAEAGLWEHLGARPARFHCVDRIAVTGAEKQKLWNETGAGAVEMESGIIRACCQKAGIPAATLRIISDPAQESLPLDFNQLQHADRTLNWAALLGQVARRPRVIPALLALQRHTAAAARTLADAIEQFSARWPAP